MNKIVFAWLFMVTFSWANTYVFVDLSEGMDRSVYNELGKLTYFNSVQKKSIYKNGEEVYFYAFKGNVKLKAKTLYSEKNIGESKYKYNRAKFMKFFGKIRKGLKKPKRGKLYGEIVFVVDTSGSMVNKHANCLADVKKAMKYLIKNKAKKTKVSIITFDGKKYMSEPKRSKVLADNLKNKEKLLTVVNNIQVSKYDTFLGSGLKKAEKLLSLDEKTKKTIMIFTDGAKINDEKTAKTMIQNFKDAKVNVKVVAVGGADVAMLQSFSTSGYVYNATSSDLKSMIQDIANVSDEVVLNLDNFFNDKEIKKGDKIIIYSSMMNVDEISDFYLVPNLASKDFYREFDKRNRQRGVAFSLNGADVYVRTLREQNLLKLKQLQTFWDYFFKDRGAKVKYFKNETLTKDEL